MEHSPHSHHAHGDMPVTRRSLGDFVPLIVIFGIVAVLTWFLHASVFSFPRLGAMRVFMGVFFLVFGGFKVVRLKGFAMAYREYDVLAKRSAAYGYVYPFAELTLGFSYLYVIDIRVTAVVTIMLMTVSALGVYKKLRLHEPIMCACLGTVFKIPMTWVTLLEDLLMAVMALVILLRLS